HLRFGVGYRAGSRQQHMEHRIPWPVPPRHHGIIWIDPVVQVLAHVLQARRCPGKKSSRSQRYDEQFAAAGGCTEKIRWWIRACAALLTGAHLNAVDKDILCRPSFI